MKVRNKKIQVRRWESILASWKITKCTYTFKIHSISTSEIRTSISSFHLVKNTQLSSFCRKISSSKALRPSFQNSMWPTLWTVYNSSKTWNQSLTSTKIFTWLEFTNMLMKLRSSRNTKLRTRNNTGGIINSSWSRW